MSTIPVLTTERLILRAHEPDDLEAVHAMWSDLRVVRHISGVPSSRPQSWSRMLCYQGLWRFLGFGYWAVTDRVSGVFLGDAGFADFKREIEPSIEGMAEAGWVLAQEASGKGVATEAMTAALDWFDAAFPNHEVVCIISPENTASIRVAGKCGFGRWTDTRFADDSVTLYRRPVTRVKS